MNQQGANTGGTVGKAVDVLDTVASLGRPARFSELLDHSAHPRATLYRILQSLTATGMLAYDAESQTYAPGLRLVRLAHAAWSHAALAPLARPALDALAEATGETIHLAQLDAGQVLYLDKRNARLPVEMFSDAGRIAPAYCTGIGKALLSTLTEAALEAAIACQSFHRYTPQTLTDPDALRRELAKVRETGLAYDREEHEPGIICVATPIPSRRGRAMGALSITGTLGTRTPRQLAGLAPQLRIAAKRIADAAEDWQFPALGRGTDGNGRAAKR